MTEIRSCPNCRLINPPTAERCDCGYDFSTGSMEKSYLPMTHLRDHVKAWRMQSVGGSLGAIAGTTLASNGLFGEHHVMGTVGLTVVGGLFGSLIDWMGKRPGTKWKP